MERSQMVLAILQYDLANGYELRQVSDEAWLARHAGGFSPISQEEMAVYEVMPERVVEMGAHLSDEAFMAFVEAIRTWQKRTLGDYLFKLAPDLIVAKFCQDYPVEGKVLMAVARHHDIDPVAFFGADHHNREVS
jgi:hypothetical protein